MIRPPSTTGFRPAIFSREVSRRALVGVEGPRTGTISRSKRPSSMARGPRVWDAQRELLLVLAADVPLLRDHLGAAELVDRLVAVARLPARATRRTAW